jgi:hypothetical protein
MLSQLPGDTGHVGWTPCEDVSVVPEEAGECRMDLPGPTTSVGTRTDYSVGPWDYPPCAAWYLMV